MVVPTTDAYHWVVTYQDGTHLQEFDEPGSIGRGFAEIGDQPVKDIWLMRPDPNLNYGHHVTIPDGAMPVFFRRRRIVIDPVDSNVTPQLAAHCIGWKRGAEAVYLFVFDNGSTLLTNDLQAV